jgi:vacuolar-type H+-ATPase subunit D/Vma8
MTDILIHVNEELEKNQKKELESELRNIEGVIAPRFNKEHLLLVEYDSNKIDTSVLLDAVKSGGYQAQLVGL